MPPLARENPFIAGLRESVAVARGTTEEHVETLRRAAVANLMTNAGQVAQRISEREAALASKHAENVRKLMEDSKLEAGGKATSEELIAKSFNDQLALTMENYAFQAQRASDAALARNVVTRAPFTLSRMNGNEQEALKMILGDDIEGAVSRLSSSFGKSGMPKMPGPGDVYDFKEINSGGRSYIGRVNKLTGRFELQDTFDDPMMELEMAKGAIGLEKTGLEMDKLRRDMAAGSTKTIDAGTQRLVEKRAKLPANWNDMTGEQREAFVAQNAAAMGWKEPLTEVDPSSGELVLRKYFSDIRPTGSSDGSGIKPKDIESWRLKAGEFDAQARAGFEKGHGIKRRADTVRREIAAAKGDPQILGQLKLRYGKDPAVHLEELESQAQTAYTTAGQAQDNSNRYRSTLERAGLPVTYHDTSWRQLRPRMSAEYSSLTSDRRDRLNKEFNSLPPNKRQQFGNDLLRYYYSKTRGVK